MYYLKTESNIQINKLRRGMNYYCVNLNAQTGVIKIIL